MSTSLLGTNRHLPAEILAREHNAALQPCTRSLCPWGIPPEVVSGVVKQLLLPEGSEVAVGTPIALIEAPGEAPAPPAAVPSAAPAAPRRWRASPVVRRLARENRIDLSRISGSGPGGRIILRDVEPLLGQPAAAAPAPGAAPAPAAAAAPTGDRWEAFTPLRRATARQMIRAAAIPQFRVALAADVTGLEEVRGTLNRMLTAGGGRLSLTDFLVQACAQALREHPRVNASYDEASGGGVWLQEAVNVGLAVAAVGGGLRVPVIAGADRLGLVELARRRADLVQRARAGRVSEAELSGATFTVSNLGGYGVASFDAIVNPPQAAILSVGKVQAEQEGQRLYCTLTADHRVLDGAEAAQFLVAVVRRLESGDGWRLI